MGRLFGLEASLPISTQSAAFSGRYVSRDKLMWLVRTLMSWDEWGAECEPPGNRSHELDAWRTRWTAITAAKPTRRRTPAAVAPAEAEPIAAAPPAPAPPAPAPAPAEAVPPQPPPKEVAESLPPGQSPDEPPAPSGIASFSPASAVLSGHSSTIRSVAFSPDGTLLATASGDGTARLYEREALSDMNTRRLEFHHRVGTAMLNVYRGTTGGGGAPSEEPLAEVYRDVLEAAETTFARATETEDVEQMIAGWDEFTEIATHLGQSSALLGAVLLGSLVEHTGLSPQEVIAQAIATAQAHPAGRQAALEPVEPTDPSSPTGR
ncbi:WD40 repeat domain-containing protein [Streptomyces sp. NPDC127074]|uniref:WD40 repeat domain-containing protein n=1 Tax=Streptomyces sp. NPDC127074 TaxID=3347130 RepID=UPI0036526FA3